ncbi:MAG: hypothetical protein F6K47_34435 [Symploca sp. SIO2E6]|nr:hypothetical protein [Symploca sp. SIO2E6]
MKKTLKYWLAVPTTLAVLLTNIAGVRSQQQIALTPGFNEPMVFTGTSGESNCTQMAATASHVITLGDNFSYLRFTVDSQSGQPILLIKGPNGSSSCVQADEFSGSTITDSGYWNAGTYSLYIGDRTGNQHNYSLSITQQQ